MARGKKYTRRVSKNRRKTKRGAVRTRHPEYEVREHSRAAMAGLPPPNMRVLDLKRHNVIYKVMNGDTRVDSYSFGIARDELMKIARDDFFKNKENPEMFRRITELGARIRSGKSATPTARQRGAFVYCDCLKCEHVNCDDNWLPEFQVTKDYQEPTTIPHNYHSVLWHSLCQAGGRSDPKLGLTHSGYLPCWLNKKFDK
jgi:hypothetical protein